MLTKAPGFTAVAVLTLAVGIAATTTIFSVVNAILFRPLRLEDPDRLVVLYETNLKQQGRRNPTMASYLEWQKHTQAFEEIGRSEFGGVLATLSGAGQAERVRLSHCTPNFLSVLGAKAFRGRTFLPEDAQLGTSTVIISHSLWQRSFGADPNVLGKTIAIEGRKRTVIGIMPPGLSIFPWESDVDVWLAYNPTGNPQSRWLVPIGRLKPGATIEQAQAELNTIARRLAQAHPEADADWSIGVDRLHETIVQDSRGALYVLLGAVGFVLLIACTNVANLLLARAATRQKEIAVRASVGAGRLRLLRQLLTESILLGLLGGLTGVLLTFWGIEVFLALAPAGLASSLEISIDATVLGFALGLSMLTGILFGLAPAFQASKPDLNESLKEAGGRSAGGARHLSRSVLVASEVALALVLLVGAGLMINSFLRLQRVDLGFNPKNVLTADIFLTGPKYWQHAGGDMKRVTPQGAVFFQQVLERVEALPGVESAAVTHLAPPRGTQQRSIRILGQPASPSGQQPRASYSEVSPGFFRTLQIPLLKGRYLTDRDVEQSPWVVVINQTMARKFFPDEDPIGKQVQLAILGGSSGLNVEEDRPREIVGVVGDVRHFGFGGDLYPVMYGTYLQHGWEYPGGLYMSHLWKDVIIRAHSDPMALASAVQGIVAEVDKDQAVFNIESMEQGLDESLSSYGFLMRLFGIFGGLAVMLAVVGIYGVMSYSVTQRTHEFGVRLALGAGRGDVLRLVIMRGLKITVIGVVIGIAGSLALTRLISGMLYGVKATDPLTYTIVAVVLMAVALLACYIPARRATKVDPMVALRYE
jgi:putative ABC transport system permease protein